MEQNPQQSGFLIINKPKGLTSFQVIAQLRRITGVKKIGHAGTLDPMATGVLVCAVGRDATRKISEIQGHDKEYRATIRLGCISSTYDADGEITVVNPGSTQEHGANDNSEIQITKSKLQTNDKIQITNVEKALEKFVGDIRQVAPMYSARKIGGKKAYDMARAGEKFNPGATDITIHSIEIIEWKEILNSKPSQGDPFGKTLNKIQIIPRQARDPFGANKSQSSNSKLTIDVCCSSGTYIRSLAHDIGQELGVGGYLEGLVRTRVGKIELDESVRLEEITTENWQSYLRDIDLL